MLLQSRGGRLELLPALPAAWPDGEVRGLRGRGGFSLDITWQAGRLQSATIHATRTGLCRVRYQGQELVVADTSGDTVETTHDGAAYAFTAEAGGTYVCRPAG